MRWPSKQKHAKQREECPHRLRVADRQEARVGFRNGVQFQGLDRWVGEWWDGSQGRPVGVGWGTEGHAKKKSVLRSS